MTDPYDREREAQELVRWLRKTTVSGNELVVTTEWAEQAVQSALARAEAHGRAQAEAAENLAKQAQVGIMTRPASTA